MYKGSVDCFRQTINKEGFCALYKGEVELDYLMTDVKDNLSFRISSMLDKNGSMVAHVLVELRTNPKVTRCRRVLIAFNRSICVYLVVAYSMLFILVLI